VKTGRNDPCPCGSGKKYKQCCLGKGGDEQRSGAAQSIADEIAAAAAEQPFASLDEINAFTSQLMNERNRSARLDFCGLSPEQMSHLLYAPFTSQETVRFAMNIEPGPDVEIMGLFLALVRAIGESGLKATAKGNLPLKFCQSMAQQLREGADDQRSLRIGGVRSETDLEQLHCTRLVAELAGLIRKYRGKFVLTRKCKDLLSRHDLGGLYFELFKTYSTKFNWAYRDLYSEAQIVQTSFLYTLFLLSSFGDQQRHQQFYEDRFLTAFPMLIDMFEETGYSTAESSARHCYVLRALDRFAAFFGLAKLVRDEPGVSGTGFIIRKTDLLDRFVAFAPVGTPPGPGWWPTSPG
jgi:hypothetical protein